MSARQKLITAVVSQFMRPRGLLGRLAGWEMALRLSNVRRNRWAVGLLDVQTTDRVLEIGFGPGIAIRELARRASRGFVVGVDHSDTMVRQARRRNAAAVQAGCADLRIGSAEALPRFDEPFDKVLTVNSIMFWDDPVRRLKEVRGMMRAGGTIAVVRQPRGPRSSRMTEESVADEISRMLQAAGFTDIRTESLPLKPPAVCGLGTRRD